MPVRVSKRGCAGEAAVDDDPDAVDRQRRLGDVGRQHDAPAPGGRRGECSVLFGRVTAPRRAGTRRRRADRWSAAPPSVRLISPMPGRNTRTSPLSSSQRPLDGVDDVGSIRRPGSPTLARPRPPPRLDGLGGIQRMSTSNMRPAVSITGASESRRARRCRAWPTSRGCGDRAEASPRRRARSARPRSVVEVALVHLVEDHESDAGELRVVLESSREDPLGHDLDPRVGADVAFVAGLVADGAADRLAEQCRPSGGRRPVWRVAAVRASGSADRPATARRAGRAGRPWSCPAPGGATSTARCRSGEGGSERGRWSRRPEGRGAGARSGPARSPGGRCAGERARVARRRDRRHVPLGGRGDRLGDRVPLGGVPALGRRPRPRGRRG